MVTEGRMVLRAYLQGGYSDDIVCTSTEPLKTQGAIRFGNREAYKFQPQRQSGSAPPAPKSSNSTTALHPHLASTSAHMHAEHIRTRRCTNAQYSIAVRRLRLPWSLHFHEAGAPFKRGRATEAPVIASSIPVMIQISTDKLEAARHIL